MPVNRRQTQLVLAKSSYRHQGAAHDRHRPRRARPRPRPAGPRRHPPSSSGTAWRRRRAGTRTAKPALRRFVERMAAAELAPCRRPPTGSTTRCRPPSSSSCSAGTSSTASGLWEPGVPRPSTRPRRRCWTSPAQRADLARRPAGARAGLRLGQPLPSGWPTRYPRSRIIAVSNSGPQGAFIRARAAERGLSQPRGGHRRHERASAAGRRCAVRPGGLGGDVRAHAQLAGAPAPDRRLAGAGRPALRPRLRPPVLRLSLRGGRRSATGWPATSSPAASCRRTTCSPASPVRSWWRSAGSCRARTTRAPPRPGWSGSTPNRRAAAGGAAPAAAAGRGAPPAAAAGGSSSWPAPSCSASAAGRSGWSRTTGCAPAAGGGGARVKIAVIGSGVSGLVCAHLLSPRHDVVLFEADARIGGHVHTVDVAAPAARWRWTPASSSSTTGPTRASSGCWSGSASPPRRAT